MTLFCDDCNDEHNGPCPYEVRAEDWWDDDFDVQMWDDDDGIPTITDAHGGNWWDV